MFQHTDIALVTGAGSGIGRATCLLLAREGATVVASDINKQAADDTVRSLTGQNHLSVQVDVISLEAVSAAVHDVIARYSSPPNIAVNCAGLFDYESLLDVTEDSYNKLFDVNIKGTMWVTQAVCRELLARKMQGSIVNVSSLAKEGASMITVYAASKGAVDAFSRSAAKEFGREGIRVNSVVPGLTETPMISGWPEGFQESHNELCPLNRTAKPEEIAEAIVFLASSRSSYVNGSSLFVDGGKC